MIFNEHIPGPGHSFSQFPGKNYFSQFSHPEQESQEDTERDIARHILNGLIFNKKRRETSKATLLPSSGDGTEKKFHGETSLFNGCTYTQREICNHVLEGKKLIKRFKLQQKWGKPQNVLTVASFEGDDEKRSTLASNTYSFNGCLLLTCFIITKLIIYSFYHHNNENLWESSPLHLLHRYWSEIRFGVRIQRAGQHTPHHDVPGIPNRICQSSDRPHFVNKKSQRNTPLPLPNRYWQEP